MASAFVFRAASRMRSMSRLRCTEGDRFVPVAEMRGTGIGVGIHSHRTDADLVRGASDAHSHLAAVGDEDFPDGQAVHYAALLTPRTVQLTRAGRASRGRFRRLDGRWRWSFRLFAIQAECFAQLCIHLLPHVGIVFEELARVFATLAD